MNAYIAPLSSSGFSSPTTVICPSTCEHSPLSVVLAGQIQGFFRRDVFIRETVIRRYPVESSCVRRRQGKLGLTVDEHSIVRIAGPLQITNTVYYFVDNVASTGTTLEACHLALGFGDGIVYANQGKL